MKRSAQTGFLPLLALTIALGFSFTTVALAKPSKQRKPHRSIDDSALFKKSDYSIFFGIESPPPGTELPPPFKNKRLDCSSVPKRPLNGGQTAWERGFNQGISGMRASNKVTIGKHTLPDRKPCEEYDSLAAASFKGQEERACCARAFIEGMNALATYLRNGDKKPPTERIPLDCYKAFETGTEAAHLLCGQCKPADQAEQDLKDNGIDLTTMLPGCMAMGFHQATQRCISSTTFKRRAASSAFSGSVRDRRSGPGKTDDLVGQFNRAMGIDAGSAHVGHNHGQDVTCSESCPLGGH